MRRRIDDPLGAINTGSYSPALRAGPWILVSGQGPITPEGVVVPGDITVQTRVTLENIRRLVEAAGGSMNDVMKCSCFLNPLSDFKAFDAAYREFFSEPYPTRTTVEAGLDGILVEIDAMAYVEARS